MDIGFDSEFKRLAVATSYGRLGSFAVYSKHKKWYGGEIVVINTATHDESVRIFCELSEIANLSEENTKDEKATAEFEERLRDGYRRCLPVRVGLTEDGTKVIGVTSTGVCQVFDADSGRPELILSNKGRAGSEMYFD